MVLYHIFPTRSTRVLWLIHELGLKDACKVKLMQWKEIKQPQYLAINPNGSVPGFSYGDQETMFEAGAIIRFILDQVADKSAVDKLTKSWTRQQWSKHYVYEFWTVTTLDGKLISNLFGAAKLKSTLSGSIKKWWNSTVVPKLERDLVDNKFLQGDEFSLTDIYLGYTLFIASAYDPKLVSTPKLLSAYYKRVTDRVCFKSCFSK